MRCQISKGETTIEWMPKMYNVAWEDMRVSRSDRKLYMGRNECWDS